MNNKTASVLVGTAIVIGGATFYLSNQPPVQAPINPATASTQMPSQTIKTMGQLLGRAGPDGIYPDVPGVIDPDTTGNVAGTICNSSWSTKSIRPSVSVTDPIKTVALARYNQEFGTSYVKADGELDHIISLELGGAPADTQNLYFEPYITQVNGVQVGAHEKDKVENELHKEVCAGTLTLSEAQRIITSDWYAFYLSKHL